jgi:hypothetical protein
MQTGHRATRYWVGFGCLGLILISAYLLGTSHSIYSPKPFDEAKLESAVRWLQSNGKTALQGGIRLPPPLAGLSADGNAYVSHGVIFFPSWIGRKTLLSDPFCEPYENWIEGYCFSDKSLVTMADHPDKDGFWLEMDLTESAHKPDGTWTLQMAVNRRLSARWYDVDSFS